MQSVNFHDPVLWSFLPTSVTLDLAKEINHKLLLYYCTDNFSATSREAGRVVKTEEDVIRHADLVFAMSRKMVDYCKQFSEEVWHIPMGVNTEFFEEARSCSMGRPKDLEDVRKPIIGYVGGVRSSIDKHLVGKIAEEMDNCSLVFIGPIQTDVSDLTQYQNIKFLGMRDHNQIPRYIQSFDSHGCSVSRINVRI